MYENFDEIINNMVTPEENEDNFLELILTSKPDVSGKLLFTQNFDYDLNPAGYNGFNFYVNNIRIKANVFLNSVNRLSEDEFKKKQDSITHPRFLRFIEFLSNIDEDKYRKYYLINKNDEITNENIKKRYIRKYIRFIEHPSDRDKKMGMDFLPMPWCWYYYCSYNISPSMKEAFYSDDIKHRLYVSINYDQLTNLTRDFINKLEELQIPYLMKIKSCLPSGKCPDNDVMVIYADNEKRVTDYVNILNELINKNSDYKNAIHKPSAHLGIIDNQIGYGREFAPGTSYTGVVGDLANTAKIYALQDVTYGIRLSDKFTPKEMLTVMKSSYSYNDMMIYYDFKNTFWKKFYELLQENGYDIGDSFCIADREWSKNIKF